MTGHATSARRLAIATGPRAQTAAVVAQSVAGVPPAEVAWVGTDAPPGVLAAAGRDVAAWLGRSLCVVVVDAHDGLDPDVLAQVHGVVRGGGWLILRIGDDAPVPATRLAAHPHGPSDVTTRFQRRALAILRAGASPLPSAITVAPWTTAASSDQDAVVAALRARWAAPTATRTAVLADRGRGKSSAIGRALPATSRIAVTAGDPAAVAEVLRFASAPASFVPLTELLAADASPDLIVVDEAAQLPVPLLQRLVTTHPTAHLVFSTTTHGYEGTGRGFSLRFLEWLARRGPVDTLTLDQPIRWAEGDPLERTIFAALLLDAEPADPAPDPPTPRGPLEITALDRDALMADDALLREVFGLLVHAHYRTTPGDLHRILDAPNLSLAVAREHGRVVGVTVLATEGRLPPALTDDALTGRSRLRAHALPDALVAHLGHPEAGSLAMLRSVRIAVHPDCRRRRIASRIVEHVHATHDVDLFGTLFGATPELIAFRRSLGYQVVRVSASRGTRTGEPSVLMLRPVTDAARHLVTALRDELAHELPTQLDLLAADEDVHPDPALAATLAAGLPSPAARTLPECAALARAYAHGPRTFESCAAAIARWLAEGGADLGRLDPSARRLVEGRVARRHGWRRVTADAGLPTVAASMRALRRAIRALVADHP